MTTKLAGIIISTHNFAQMKSFYTNTLGLKISRQKKNQLTFKHENFKFIITTHSKVIGQAKDPHRIMLNFVVNNIESEYLRLKQKIVSNILKGKPPRDKVSLIDQFDNFMTSFGGKKLNIPFPSIATFGASALEGMNANSVLFKKLLEMEKSEKVIVYLAILQNNIPLNQL